jgi:hypothetical protein
MMESVINLFKNNFFITHFPMLSNPINYKTNNCPNSADNNTVKFKKRNKD